MKRERADLVYLMFVFLALAISAVGCATQGKSVGLGGAIGSGTGAIAGGLMDPGRDGEYRTRNVVIGGTLGAMAGMVTGALVYDHTEKEKKEAFLKGQAAAPTPGATGSTAPTLKPARVESQWIEGHPMGTNRWVEGHFEYVISEPARFTQ
jgi:hypothetical protein